MFVALALLAVFALVFTTPSPLDYDYGAPAYKRAWRRHHRWTACAVAVCVALTVL